MTLATTTKERWFEILANRGAEHSPDIRTPIRFGRVLASASVKAQNMGRVAARAAELEQLRSVARVELFVFSSRSSTRLGSGCPAR